MDRDGMPILTDVHFAAWNGDLDALRRAAPAAGEDGHDAATLTFAARGRSLDCMRFVVDSMASLGKAVALDEGLAGWAAAAGDVECLRFAMDLGAPCRDAAANAALAGNVDCLELLRSRGIHLSSEWEERIRLSRRGPEP